MNNIKVNRVEQQIIKRNNPIFKIVDCYCLYSKNVYNEANYIMRQEFVNNGNKLNANDIQKLMQNMNCYKECGSQAAQKTIQLVDKMWKSFLVSIKDYYKNPNKYLGKPKLPKYLKKDGRQVFMLKNIQCSLKDGLFRISFKPFKGYTVKTHAKKIRPLSLRCQCEKCHKEYRRELMYRCNCGIYNNYYGCAQCFPNKNNFLKWLQDNDILYTEESLKNCLKREELDE